MRGGARHATPALPSRARGASRLCTLLQRHSGAARSDPRKPWTCRRAGTRQRLLSSSCSAFGARHACRSARCCAPCIRRRGRRRRCAHAERLCVVALGGGGRCASARRAGELGAAPLGGGAQIWRAQVLGPGNLLSPALLADAGGCVAPQAPPAARRTPLRCRLAAWNAASMRLLPPRRLSAHMCRCRTVLLPPA